MISQLEARGGSLELFGLAEFPLAEALDLGFDDSPLLLSASAILKPILSLQFDIIAGSKSDTKPNVRLI